MTRDADLVDRLATLPNLATMPRNELKWLVARGRLDTLAAGTVVAPKGLPVEYLWIIVSGSVSVSVDRGGGPRQVMVWQRGDVTGRLPYSRMARSPGRNKCDEPSELLAIHQDNLPEMIAACPTFTAYAVHLMLDRARGFNSSALHDERMISIGRLAAGLAHELNNPTSAAMRSAKVLRESLDEADAALASLRTAGLSDASFAVITRIRAACETQAGAAELTPMQAADAEAAIADWLDHRHLDAEQAAALAEAGATIEQLDDIAAVTDGPALDAALRWIAASCGTRALTSTIEHAATRIHELVAAVKGFTYLDRMPEPGPVDVGHGLRDTISVLAAKRKASNATVTIEIEPNLPRAHAVGSELNQVWLNLIDNALDAVPPGGHVTVSAGCDGDRIVIRVVDDGPGIPPEVVGQVFDPFFTTKPPGEGTGLGLDIARRLLQRHKGDITVTSAPGRTEFRVSLALEPGPGPADPPA